jgi:hypothetical protein
MIKDLVKLANKLDEIGLAGEADILDSFVKKLAQEMGQIPKPGRDEKIYEDETRKSRAIEEGGRDDAKIVYDDKTSAIKHIQSVLGVKQTGTWDPTTDKEFTAQIYLFANSTITDPAERDRYLSRLFLPGHYADGRFQVDSPKFVGKLDDAIRLIHGIKNINQGESNYLRPDHSAYPSPFEQTDPAKSNQHTSTGTPQPAGYVAGYFIVTSEDSLFNNVEVLAKSLKDTDFYSNVEGRISSLYSKHKKNSTLRGSLGRAFYANFYKNILKDNDMSTKILSGRKEPEYDRIWNKIKADIMPK